MSRRCVFCGGEKLSREHVWPEWSLKLFPPEPDAFSRMQFNFASGDEPIVRVRPAETMEQVVRSVCERCNSGWMSRLENDSKPYVVRMIRGESLSLDEHGQTLVSAWATKTALMLSLTLPHRLVADRYFQEFYERRSPPGHGIVYLSSFAGEARSWYHIHGVDFFEPGSDQRFAHGWAASFVLGHLAVQVLGNDFPEPMNHNPDKYVRMGLIRIAPQGHPLRRWPPAMRLDDDSLDAFARITMVADDRLGPNVSRVVRPDSSERPGP